MWWSDLCPKQENNFTVKCRQKTAFRLNVISRVLDVIYGKITVNLYYEMFLQNHNLYLLGHGGFKAAAGTK